MFSVYGRMTALPGRRQELIAVLLAGLRAGGADFGLIDYRINAAFNDPDSGVYDHETKDMHDVFRLAGTVARTAEVKVQCD